jgi:hypothetical protein
MDTRTFRIQRSHGLITRPAALEAGFDDRDIARFVRGGAWIVVRRGVYAEAAFWLHHGGDVFAGQDHQRRLRSRAVHLGIGSTEAVFSHDSAALEHGLPLLSPAGDLVHVTTAGSTDTHRGRGVAHHRSPFDPTSVEVIDGLPVLGLARTAVDLGREHGYLSGLVAMDAALRRGTTRNELEDLRRSMASWRHITAVEAALRDADPGAESAGETLLRTTVQRLRIGDVRTQFPVRLGDGSVAWLDVLVGCHDFEFDGRVKFTHAGAGGVATKPADEVAWEEKKRERLIRAEGVGVSRSIWEDVASVNALADRRLLEEFRRTCEAYGSRLPAHMEEFAARMEPERQRRLAVRRQVPRLD